MEQRIKRTKARPLFLAVAFLTAMAVSLLLQTVPAFAADGDAEENVTVAITVGEHGAVNGHTGSFSENVKSGENLTLTMQADVGYVIETVLVNETELEAADLEGVAGKKNGEMTLEGIEEDMTVEVSFQEDDSAGEGAGDAGDPEPGADETGGDGTDDPADAETPDPAAAETPDPAGAEVDDPTASDPADTGGDSGAEDGTDPAGQEPGDTGSDGSDAQSGEDEPAADQTDDSTSQSDDKESVSEGKDGKGSATPDKGSSYVSDASPKTGDSLPMKAIVMLIASLGVLSALAADRILRRHHRLQD